MSDVVKLSTFRKGPTIRAFRLTPQPLVRLLSTLAYVDVYWQGEQRKAIEESDGDLTHHKVVWSDVGKADHDTMMEELFQGNEALKPFYFKVVRRELKKTQT